VREIGEILTHYIGGQIRICLILSVLYAVGFALCGVPLWALAARSNAFRTMAWSFGSRWSAILSSSETVTLYLA